MNDKIKLIIEIDKYYYERIKFEAENYLTDYKPFVIIANGTLLDENKGEWIYQQGIVPYKWRCNKCEKMFKTDFNYCPNCGARMNN